MLQRLASLLAFGFFCTLAAIGATSAWTAASDEARLVFVGHFALTRTIGAFPVAASRDGRYVATYDERDLRLAHGAFDRSVTMYDGATGSVLRKFAVSAAQHRVGKPTQAVVADDSGPHSIAYFPPEDVRAFALSDDGAKLALLTSGSLAVIDVATERTLWSVPVAADLKKAAFSPDARDVFVLGGTTLEKWSARDGRLEWLQRISSLREATALAVSPDGIELAMEDVGGSVVGEDARDGTRTGIAIDVAAAKPSALRAVPGTALAFSLDSRLLVSAFDGTITVRATPSYDRISQANCGREVDGVAFNLQSNVVAGCGSDVVEIDATTGAIGKERFAGHEGVVRDVFLTPRQRLWAISKKQTACVWSLATRAAVDFLGAIRSASFSRDGSRLAYVLDDGVSHVVSSKRRRVDPPDEQRLPEDFSRATALVANGNGTVSGTTPDGRIVVASSLTSFRATSKHDGRTVFANPSASQAATEPGHVMALSDRFAVLAITQTFGGGDRTASAYRLRLRSLKDGALLDVPAKTDARGFVALGIRAEDREVYVVTLDGLDVWSIER